MPEEVDSSINADATQRTDILFRLDYLRS